MKNTTTNLLSTKFLAFIAALFCLQASAQQLPRVTQFEEDEVNISLDGLVDESVWQSIPAIDGMKRMDPDTLEDAPYKTDIRFFIPTGASTSELSTISQQNPSFPVWRRAIPRHLILFRIR